MSASHMDELRRLIATACDANVSANAREGAERNILEIQRCPDTWKIYIELLQSADDSILFFIGQGLKYAVIKYWHNLSATEQKLFSDKVLYCLLTRGSSLLTYSKSKIDQVVSTICIQRDSTACVIDFLNASNCSQTVAYYSSTCAQQYQQYQQYQQTRGGHGGLAGGAQQTLVELGEKGILDMLLVSLSLVRTVLEDVCTTKTSSINSKKGAHGQGQGSAARRSNISSNGSAVVEELLSSYASTYVELACGTCTICYYLYFVQFQLPSRREEGATVGSGTLQGEFSSKLSAVLLSALQCLRAIVAHVPIGGHLGSDVFDLLVRLASLSVGDCCNGSGNSSGNDNSTLSAITGAGSGMSSPGMLSWSTNSRDCASPAATVMGQITSSVAAISALAIDTLSELMWLKYLPTSDGGSSGGSSNVTGVVVVDGSILVLMTLLSAATTLLTHYRCTCTRDVSASFSTTDPTPGRVSSGLSVVTTNWSHDWEELPQVLALVSFIAAFVQCHLERCIKFTITGLKANGGGAGDTAVAEACGAMCILLLTLLQELQRLTIQARSAGLVTRLAVIWKDMIELLHTYQEGAIMPILGGQGRAQTGVALPSVWNTVVRHLLLCSLYQHNDFLVEDLEEATEDLQLHPYVDSNIRSAVIQFGYNANVDTGSVTTVESGVGGAGTDEDAEDGNAVLALLKATTACITCALEFTSINHTGANMDCIAPEKLLSATIPELFQKSISVAFSTAADGGSDSRNGMSAGTPLMSPASESQQSVSSMLAHHPQEDGAGAVAQAILDCSFLLPFLPLMGISTTDLVPQLISCLSDLRLHTKGKLFTYFYIQCCHMVSRLLSAHFIAEYVRSIPTGSGLTPTDVVPVVITQLMVLTSNFCQAAFVVPVPHPVMVSTFSLLLNVLMQCSQARVINNPTNPAAVSFNMQLLPATYQSSMQQMIASVSACLPGDVLCLLHCIHYYLSPERFLNLTNTQLEAAGNAVCALSEASVRTGRSSDMNTHCSNMTRVLAAVESSTLLLQTQSSQAFYIQRKQQVLDTWSSLPLILPAVLQTSLTLVHAHLCDQVAVAVAAASTGGGSCGIQIVDVQATLLNVARLVITATKGLLITFGKMAYGAVACCLFGTCGRFLLSSIDAGVSSATTSVTVLHTLLVSANPMKAIPFLKECLQLSMIIGETGSSFKVQVMLPDGANTGPVPNSGEILQLTFALLTGVSAQMHLATVRSEMLHSVLESGWSLVRYFWVKSPLAITLPAAPSSESEVVISGANVQPVVEFLTQLFATCMVNETVAPGDVLSCIDNMVSMSADGRTLFSTPWFVQNCRQSVILSTLRALLLNFHSPYHDQMIGLLQVIVNQTSESSAEYEQYLGSVVTGVALEFGCQIEAEFVIQQHRRQMCAQTNGSGSNNPATNSKLDIDQYVQSVVYVVQKLISSSESCLKI